MVQPLLLKISNIAVEKNWELCSFHKWNENGGPQDAWGFRLGSFGFLIKGLPDCRLLSRNTNSLEIHILCPHNPKISCMTRATKLNLNARITNPTIFVFQKGHQPRMKWLINRKCLRNNRTNLTLKRKFSLTTLEYVLIVISLTVQRKRHNIKVT